MGDGSFVVEARPHPLDLSTSSSPPQGGEDWKFTRICYLAKVASNLERNKVVVEGGKKREGNVDRPSRKERTFVWVGVYGCCPDAQKNCKIEFTNFSIIDGVEFAHTADSSHETDPLQAKSSKELQGKGQGIPEGPFSLVDRVRIAWYFLWFGAKLGTKTARVMLERLYYTKVVHFSFFCWFCLLLLI